MRALTQKFDHFFSVHGYQYSLRLFAQGVGLYYMAFLLSIRPSWNFFFGWNGVSAGLPRDYFDFLRFLDFIPFSFFWLLGFAVAFIHFRGKNLEITSILLFVYHSLLIHRNTLATNGEDLVLRMLLFYGLFFPWIKSGSWRGPWAIRLAQINLLLIYYLSLPKKLASDAAWWNGDFMYYVFVNPSWSRISDWSPSFLSSISPSSTYLSLFVELGFPILIWFSRWRRISILVLMLFHFSIAFLLSNVTFFSITMILGLLLFLKNEDFEWLKSLIQKRSASGS
jgi:hypothetical protein